MEERLYDLVFICMPTTPEEEITKLIATLEEAAGKYGAKVEKVAKWGARKMAYRVAKQREGYYVLMVLRCAQGEVIKELERRLRVTDAVIKYMKTQLISTRTVNPGQHGGKMMCGYNTSTGAKASECLWVTPSTFGMVEFIYGQAEVKYPGASKIALEVRNAVEVKAS